MIKLTFTSSDIAQLHYEQLHHSHPRVQRKMKALYLKSQGLPHREIIQRVGISEPTLLKYLHDYQAGGVERLKVLPFYRPQSELKQHQATIAAYFRAYPPQTLAQAAAKITELTGIKRSDEQVRQFLKVIGIRCGRVGGLPIPATRAGNLTVWPPAEPELSRRVMEPSMLNQYRLLICPDRSPVV